MICKVTYRGITQYRIKIGKRYYTLYEKEINNQPRPLKDITNDIYAPKSLIRE